MNTPNINSPLVYVGTYTFTEERGQHRVEGIFVYRFDRATGALTLLSTTKGVINPSFLAVDPRRRYLFAVNEVSEFAGRPGGGVSAFAIDPQTGALAALNQQPTFGADPCYVCVDQGGKWLLAANYSGGSVAVFPIGEDGHLGPATELQQHRGSGEDPHRQEAAHAHSVIIDPSNRYALVADLGLDRIMLYELDSEKGKLKPYETPWVSVRPGAGPRHMAFHPGGRYLYLANELNSTVTAFTYDASSGRLQEIHSLSLLPDDFNGRSYSADIHVTPSGSYLYASNRGHDSLAIFAIDQDTGRLTALGHASTLGHTPRNFAIDPAGAYLLAANQDSDTVVTFRIDPRTGQLTLVGPVATVPSPVCVLFVEL